MIIVIFLNEIVLVKEIWREKCTEKKELGYIKRIYLDNLRVL
jgi:hypothetical protein